MIFGKGGNSMIDWKDNFPCDLRVVEALMDMVNQHCQIKVRGKYYVHHMCLSANENAFDVLEDLGLLRKGKPKGCYTLQWKKVESVCTK